MTSERTASRTVIVGAGHAGVQVAVSLRERGFQGSISLVNGEDAVPYQRPPLSKNFLADPAETMQLLRHPDYYLDRDIELVATRAIGVDRVRRTVDLEGGGERGFDQLVLAVGAADRPLRIPGARADGVHALRTGRDAERLRVDLGLARDVVVIGGGFIGLEVAAAARRLGCAVTVLEAGERVMARAVSAPMSAFLAMEHERAGVVVRTGRRPVSIATDGGRVTSVLLDDGRRVTADLVVVGVGVSPRTGLAAAAGLPVENGVCVDKFLRTADPAIWAIGDCAALGTRGARRRLESVQNAVDQARCVAEQLTGGGAPFVAVPWFWTHQYASKLQIAGTSAGPGEDVAVGGGPGFSVYRFEGGLLRAVESVGRPGDHLAARRVLATRRRPTPADVREPGFSLKTFAMSADAVP